MVYETWQIDGWPWADFLQQTDSAAEPWERGEVWGVGPQAEESRATVWARMQSRGSVLAGHD